MKYSLSKGSHSWHPSTMGVSASNEEKTRWNCLFGVSSCHFGRTPKKPKEILLRHRRWPQLGEVGRKSEPMGQRVEVQEEMQFI